MRPVIVVAIALLLPVACGKKKERAPLAPGVTTAQKPIDALKELASSQATAPAPTPPGLASALASAVSSITAPAPTASASLSAVLSASAAPNTLGPLATRMLGMWGFAAFDLNDPDTNLKWSLIPAADQKDILAEAPKATIEFTPQKLISRLQGVPDKTSTWTLESETATEVVIKTNDDGRKRIKFPMADAMRIEELDKKGAFVTLFARRKALPAPSASASK